MRFVLDTTVFFTESPMEGEIFTTPSVVGELLDLRSKGRYEALLAAGLTVLEPGEEARKRVKEVARSTGDAGVASGTDTDVIALALELGASVMTDDFAVQNIAGKLGIPVRPILQRAARQIKWKFRCTGCGRMAEGPGECHICGAPVVRKRR